MANSSGFLTSDWSEKSTRSLEQLFQAFPGAEIPSGIQNFAGSEVAIGDLYQNLKHQLADGEIPASDKLLLATALASASGSSEGVHFFGSAAKESGIPPEQISEAIGVAGICTIFNQYYHFKDLGDEAFQKMEARFYANSFAGSSLKATMVELKHICFFSEQLPPVRGSPPEKRQSRRVDRHTN